MGVKDRSGPRMAEMAFLLLISILTTTEAGLLGAGQGAGSCAAFPNRTPTTDLDHVAGCPRYAECCSEFGYCHPKESWIAGYFRDCNGQSNGQALEGGVIREEALEAASNQGQAAVDAQFLGISQEVWESHVNKAIQIITTSSSSTSSSSSSLSTSSLVAQILAAIQPEIAGAVQSAVASSTGSRETVSIQGGSSAQENQAFSNFGQTNFGSSSFDSAQQNSFGSTLDSSSFDFGSTSTLPISSSIRAPPTSFASLGSTGTGLSSTFDSSSLSSSSNFDSSSSSSSSSSNVSDLVALIIGQLTPEIANAVKQATSV